MWIYTLITEERDSQHISQLDQNEVYEINITAGFFQLWKILISFIVLSQNNTNCNLGSKSYSPALSQYC